MIFKMPFLRITLIVLMSSCVMPYECALERMSSEQRNGNRDHQEDSFTIVLMAVQEAKDGTLLAHRVYESTDGSRADLTFGTFGSPDLARSQLRAWLASAHKIQQKEERRDGLGNVVGEKVIATFKDKKDKEFTKVIWTDGANYYEIGSLSLATALKLEKWLYEP